MTEEKPVFTSKTILGLFAVVIGAIVPPVMAKFGYTFTAEDGTNMMDMIGKIVELGGAALAFYGRVKATKKLV